MGWRVQSQFFQQMMYGARRLNARDHFAVNLMLRPVAALFACVALFGLFGSSMFLLPAFISVLQSIWSTQHGVGYWIVSVLLIALYGVLALRAWGMILSRLRVRIIDVDGLLFTIGVSLGCVLGILFAMAPP